MYLAFSHILHRHILGYIGSTQEMFFDLMFLRAPQGLPKSCKCQYVTVTARTGWETRLHN